MIVKNEAAFLGGCLSSLQGRVDEVVIVDTGSTDDTVAIARDHGCKVLHQDWRHDFSRARNLALDHASNDWILYIDADERLVCPDLQTLGALIPAQGNAAARVRFRPRSDMTAYSELRLFLRDDRIRFDGSMHETIVPSVEAVCALNCLQIAELYDVTIDHLGYDGDQSHKHVRNLPLLRAAIEQNPDRVYLHYHLGVTLAEMGEVAEATFVLASAIQLASEQGRSARVRVEGSMSAQVLASVHLTQDRISDAMKAVEAGLALYPENMALHWMKARCHLAEGQTQLALSALGPVLAHAGEDFFDRHLAYEKSLFAEDTYALMGAAHFKAGDMAKAAECYSMALKHVPGSVEYRSKLALCSTRLAGLHA